VQNQRENRGAPAARSRTIANNEFEWIIAKTPEACE
jgi:hypothetical protein